MREVTEQLTRQTKTFVDLEGAINIGVVDETFPANGCTWFLLRSEYGTHLAFHSELTSLKRSNSISDAAIVLA